MIAVETNILVYAHRVDAPQHRRALTKLSALADSGQTWAIPWPCVHEFLSTVTKPVLRPPSTLKQAFGAIDAWLDSDSAHLIGEGDDHLERLHEICTRAMIVGSAIHDARIAAICLSHGVTELWTADRDFLRFPNLKVVNPLVA